MESPSSLSRSASATFAPGSRGRRSQTNIHHLSLAPLTPKYPVDPSDYEAYFDPATATLHTSASLSQISSVPSPGGILSPAGGRSRATSKAPRLKPKTKSTVSIQAPNDVVPPLAGEGQQLQQQRKYLRLHTDSSWLVQTGLALTEGSRESKGQSWISKRDSSTSLQSPQSPEDYILSVRARSRSMPRNGSTRQKSRRGMLSMTPSVAAITPLDEVVVPDWADSQTQAEIAAQVENELAEEFDEEDRYGVLDFEGNFFSDYNGDGNNDEEEVREAIIRGKSSWFDGVVDVFLKLEDDPSPEDDDDNDGASDLEAGTGRRSRDAASDVESPPTGPRRQGVWDDVAWFGRLLVRTVRS